ncbi:MAG: SIS domain-containing protein [Clostridia bacterium]|nr:SIS domain-containing protein [Clostridia bacterium]
MTELLIRYPQLSLCKEDILKAADAMEACYKKGGKILLCGNGGSAADCEHISGELLKGFLSKRPLQYDDRNKLYDVMAYDEATSMSNKLQRAVPCIPLTSLSASITAFANDVDPNMAFAQLTYALGGDKDILIGLSTSGNSENVVNALKVAKAMGMVTIAFTGNKPNTECSRVADITIHAPASETYLIQELHLPIYHYLCAELERRVF